MQNHRPLMLLIVAISCSVVTVVQVADDNYSGNSCQSTTSTPMSQAVQGATPSGGASINVVCGATLFPTPPLTTTTGVVWYDITSSAVLSCYWVWVDTTATIQTY